MAFVDVVGIADDIAAAFLAEDGVECHTGNDTGLDQVAQNVAGAYAGELIDIADEYYDHIFRERIHDGGHEGKIDHGDFVEDQAVAGQGVPGMKFEFAGLREIFEQPVDGDSIVSGGLAHAASCTTGGGGEIEGEAAAFIDIHQGPDNGGFADTGSTGDDGHFAVESSFQCKALLGGELDVHLLFGPGDGFGGLNGFEVGRGVDEVANLIGHGTLALVERGQIDAVVFLGEPFAGEFGFEGLGENFDADAKELFGIKQEFGFGAITVSFLGEGAHDVNNAGSSTDHGVFGDTEAHGDAVGGFKTDAPDIRAETIGVGADEGNGIGAVLPVDAGGLGGANAMALEKDHDIAGAALLVPGFLDAFAEDGADAFDFFDALGFFFDDAQGVGPEVFDEAFGHDFADAADHAAG